MNVLGVIPARLASTRLPRKVLRPVLGRPLLAWVYQAALRCPEFSSVVIAADSEEVMTLCRTNGWPAVLTDPELPSGTDRLYAVSRKIPADIYVNVQGDEPLLQPGHVTALLQPFVHAHVDVTTLKVRCTPENIENPNAVKVVTALDGRALYFSRATIPYNRDQAPDVPYFKHLGLYAYRAAALERFAQLPPSGLEQTERLEQLRLLENGLALYVSETEHDTVGVDTEADLERVEALLAQRA
ncbi:MAG: 3-deoxy-manno-octulosonate cytidylyltransferase [Acidobacteriaceae bacterium]|nr:3-deoxy-manno-octulosonate cytidylyltransferase [Acidobacteriaceae bacterium]